MIVREATLDDTQQIVSVYLTNPDAPFERPPEGMTIAERSQHGGPWMSVETCAIRLNNLLAWDLAPLVVEDSGSVIAEAEYYIGTDVPPLGKTLDISVLYVHADFQRRGAGTLLMREMISRAGEAECNHITVSGHGRGGPGYYGRFGFSHLLDLGTVTCTVPVVRGTSSEPYRPDDFDEPPSVTLWIGRFLSPRQKWREIVDAVNKREAILPQFARLPEPVGMLWEDGSLGFVVPEWGSSSSADLYCWSEAPKPEAVRDLLALAFEGGFKRACLLSHPKAASMVGEVCGSTPSGSWSIYGRRL